LMIIEVAIESQSVELISFYYLKEILR